MTQGAFFGVGLSENVCPLFKNGGFGGSNSNPLSIRNFIGLDQTKQIGLLELSKPTLPKMVAFQR